jgi:hypothetical protein
VGGLLGGLDVGKRSHLAPDHWCRYNSRFWQLERQSGHAPARSTVVVCESVEGPLKIRSRDRAMRWTDITASAAARVQAVQPIARPPSHAAPRHGAAITVGRSPIAQKHRDIPGPPIWQVRDR